jgi:hypothetical protein
LDLVYLRRSGARVLERMLVAYSSCLGGEEEEEEEEEEKERSLIKDLKRHAQLAMTCLPLGALIAN